MANLWWEWEGTHAIRDARSRLLLDARPGLGPGSARAPLFIRDICVISLPIRTHTLLHSDIWLHCIKYRRNAILYQRTQTLLGGERLEVLDLSVGVDELLDLLDLEDPIRIGGDGCDDQRFVGGVRSVLGLRLVGKL